MKKIVKTSKARKTVKVTKPAKKTVKVAASVKKVVKAIAPKRAPKRVKVSKDAKVFLASMADTFEKTPELFSQGAFARDKKGMAVEAEASNAHAFSANGFIRRAKADGVLDEVQEARVYDLFIGACLNRHGVREMVTVNDKEGRQAVIACARQAAK